MASVKTRCTHHDGHCAYDGDEPDRCPYCHTLWSAVLSRGDGESREAHIAEHDRRETARQKGIDRKRASRDALARAGMS